MLIIIILNSVCLAFNSDEFDIGFLIIFSIEAFTKLLAFVNYIIIIYLRVLYIERIHILEMYGILLIS